MTGSRSAPGLYLHSSIPVVEVVGEWDERTGSSVSELVLRLAHAGHLEIIVNLTRMTRSLQFDCNCLEALDRIAATIRSHCGRLDVVGTMDQIQQYIRKQAQSKLYWATSEEEAVGHIQGIPACRKGPILTMRLTR
jgi:hypothetical protein